MARSPHFLVPGPKGQSLRRRSQVHIALILALACSLLVPQTVAAQLQPGTRIGDFEEPTAASIAISTASRADGSAQRVVLGRRDLFPDNLSGSGAAQADGALLLVEENPAGLSADVAAELARLLPAERRECVDGANPEVILLGGEAALSGQLFDDVSATYCTSRLAGPGRADTSVAVANALLAGGGARSTLLVARDDNPADSAAAGAFAAAQGLPIVVTPSGLLHPAVRALIDPANGGAWTEIVLLGGTVALNEVVEQSIRDAAGPTTTIRRIAGATRDDTALKIATDLWGDRAGDTVMIVNGYTEDFWTYALPAGVAGSAERAPLLYVQTDLLPNTTRDYLEANLPSKLVTVGPPTRISDAVKGQAEAAARPLPDFDCDPANQPNIVDLLEGLDPEGDPDGDGFTTGQERVTFNFDPKSSMTRFNPLVADVPYIDIDVAGDISLIFNQGETNTTLSISEDERTETEQEIDTTEVTETHTVGATVGASADGKKKVGVSGSVSYQYENSTTRTTGTISTDTRRQLNREEVGMITTFDGASLVFTLEFSNPGHIVYQVDEAVVNVNWLRPDGDRRTPLGTVVVPLGTVLNEGVSSSQNLAIPIASTALARALGENLTGLEFEVGTYTLSQVGAAGVTTDAVNFAAFIQRTNQNTAPIAIDFGPDLPNANYFVSTSFRRDDNDLSIGTPLCLALGVILGLDYATQTESLIPQDDQGNVAGVDAQDVLGLTRVTTRDPGGALRTIQQSDDAGSYWIMGTNDRSVGDRGLFGLDDVNLRATDAVRLAFYEDQDGDGLPRVVEERELGTSDTAADSDEDGVGDFEELSPYSVAVNGLDPYDVITDPREANRDGDNLGDAAERELLLDPGKIDTDDDDAEDGYDPDGLDPLVRLPEAPWAYYPLDTPPSRSPGFSGTFRDAAQDHDGTSCVGTPQNGATAAAIPGVNGVADSAWDAGTPGAESICGPVLVSQAGDADYPLRSESPFTLMGFVKQDGVPAADMSVFTRGAGPNTRIIASGGEVQWTSAAYISSGGFPFVATLTSGPVTDGAWHHVAVTGRIVSGGGNCRGTCLEVTLFIDGQATDSGIISASHLIPTPASCWLVLAGTRDCDGNIDRAAVGPDGLDEVYIYGRALSEAEIDAYIAETVGDGTVP